MSDPEQIYVSSNCCIISDGLPLANLGSATAEGINSDSIRFRLHLLQDESCLTSSSSQYEIVLLATRERIVEINQKLLEKALHSRDKLPHFSKLISLLPDRQLKYMILKAKYFYSLIERIEALENDRSLRRSLKDLTLIDEAVKELTAFAHQCGFSEETNFDFFVLSKYVNDRIAHNPLPHLSIQQLIQMNEDNPKSESISTGLASISSNDLIKSVLLQLDSLDKNILKKDN